MGGNVEQFEQTTIPLAGGQVEQHRAAGVTVIRCVNASACEIPQYPAIDRSRQNIFQVNGWRDGIFQKPRQLCCRKVSINYQPRAIVNLLGIALLP